jgi:predicted nucleic acid-binding protein
MSEPTVVFCNAGPLMALGKLNRLDLLAEIYPQTQIPDAVYDEVVTQGSARGEADALVIRLFLRHHHWPIVSIASDALASFHPLVVLGKGETTVLALGQITPGALLLLDDASARREARRLQLRVQGTLGILTEAYRRRKLTRPQLELLLDEIVLRPDIWINTALCQQVLAQLPDLSE